MAADPLADWWVHRVDVDRYAGAGPEGDAWAATETGVACFVEERNRLVLAANGEQTVSGTTIAFPSTVADIPAGSRITIGAPFTPRTAVVITTSRADGGGQDTPDHLEVALS